MPHDEKLGIGRTTKLALLIAALLFMVSVPISIVALAQAHEPVHGATLLPLQMRPDYKAGFAAGAALVEQKYEQRDAQLKAGNLLCGYAKLVCQSSK